MVVAADDDRADEALLVAGKRDVEAFGLFYRRRVDAVLAFFLRRNGDRELAADLTAETFAAALAALPRYRPRRSSSRARRFVRRFSRSRSLARGSPSRVAAGLMGPPAEEVVVARSRPAADRST
jgi:hypothetical protein